MPRAVAYVFETPIGFKDAVGLLSHPERAFVKDPSWQWLAHAASEDRNIRPVPVSM
jgi:hypothetical protein